MKKVATTSTMLLLWDGALIFLPTNWYSILNTGNLHYGDVGTTVADTVTDAGTAAVTDPVADTGLVVVFILAACPAFCLWRKHIMLNLKMKQTSLAVGQFYQKEFSFQIVLFDND